jgi:uncharacterized lipoprotein YddW (UPF0748 family)
MNRMLHTALPLALAALTGCRSVTPSSSPAPGAPPQVTVTVVQATRSAPNDAERRISARSADLLARELAAAGLAVRRATDDDVIRHGLRDSVALLAYNPSPPPEERQRLAQFVKAGGRLIVFYSSDPGLAALLGFKLGPIQLAPPATPWASFVFESDRPALVPERIEQTSRIIRPVYPADSRATVLAWWENPDGSESDLPAWCLSDRGAWMSHVLQDGDARSRRRLLLGLVSHFDPRALRAAAWQSQTRHPDPRLSVLYAKGDYAGVIEADEELADRLAADYARSIPAVKGEFRAVWNHSGLGLYSGPDSWNRTAKLLADSGMNAVFPFVARAGIALYPSARLPQTDAGKALGDPLAACCEAAARHGLAVHAWKICWNLEGTPPALMEKFRAAKRLQVSDTGATLDWLCPSRPENVEWELAAIEELARRYPVQGIHLDYIRFPDKHACYCPACKAAFEAVEKKRIASWPKSVLTPPLAARYTRWRAGQISRFVHLAKLRVSAARPGAKLSAAVYGWYPGCAESLGQNWGEWVKRGDVAFVCPMNYTAETAEFAGWVKAQLPYTANGAQLVPGIGVSSTTTRLNGVQTLDQIQAARRAGAAGFILFDLTRALERDVLPLLRLGATAD